MRKENIMLAILVITVCILVGGTYILLEQPSWLKSAPQKYTGPVDKITVGVVRATVSAPIFVADAKGYFQNEGLAVDIKQFATGKAAFEAMFNGDVDIIPPADTPIVSESFARNDFYLIATFGEAVISKIFTNRDTGIKTIADLRGKKIATPMGSNAPFVLSLELTKNNIPDSAVTMLDFKPTDIALALKDRRIDAAVVWEPYIFEAKEMLADKFFILSGDDIYRPTINLVVTKKFAQSHANIMPRFLKVIDRVVSFMKENKNESVNIIAEKLKTNKEAVESAFNESTFGLSLNQSLLDQLEDQARWIKINNRTNTKMVPNYFDLIYFDGLEKVKPTVITISH